MPVAVAPSKTSVVFTSANSSQATGASYTSDCWSISYDDDSWYSFVATDTVIFVDVKNLQFPTGSIGYSVFEDSCNGSEVFCNVAVTTDTIIGLTINKTYFISLFYNDTSNRGTFDFGLYKNGTTSLSEYSMDTEIKLFPNPAKIEVSILTNGEIGDVFFIQFRDMTGKLIHTSHYQDFKAGDHPTIDIRYLANGMYLVELITSNGRSVRKLIVD